MTQLDPATIPAPTNPNPTNDDHNLREPPWRDAALQALNFRAGKDGINDYRQQLLAKAWALAVNPGSAAVVFFTKYNTAWFAYSPGGLYSVVQFAWVTDKTGTLLWANGVMAQKTSTRYLRMKSAT